MFQSRKTSAVMDKTKTVFIGFIADNVFSYGFLYFDLEHRLQLTNLQ